VVWVVYAASTQVERWIEMLSDEQAESFLAAVELLEERGPALGRPLVDHIVGSRHHKMKELRPPKVGDSVLRVLFAFTSERRGALLYAGDKAEGSRWSRWYDDAIADADRRLDEIEAEIARRPKQTGKKGKR
jgi:hypothetical protein